MNTQEELAPDFTIKPNPQKQIYQEITDAIKDNDNYCCCSILKEPDTLCMCKSFREQNESGFCHCGRFYKVKNYETIVILCDPEDIERANSMAEDLTAQGFIVITPNYRNYNFCITHYEEFREIQRTKIHKADIVLVLNTNESAMDFLSEQIFWAEELQKKIIYEHAKEVTDEN